MAEKAKDTRSEIIEAARSQFVKHGFEGARLHAIADNIGVTKAMIHYYFNTKKELFEHVYSQSVKEVFGDLNDLLSRDLPLFKKIEVLIENCLEKSIERQQVLAFIITESKRKDEWLLPLFDEQIDLELAGFETELNQAASSYKVASVGVYDLLMNIFSLCYYPVLAAPINRTLLQKDEGFENDYLQKRKGIILDTILNWLTA